MGESSIPSCQVCLFFFFFFWALSQVTSPTPDIRRRRRRHLLFGRIRVAGPGVLRWSLSLTTGMSMRVCLLYTNKYLLIREREEVGMVDFYGIAQENERKRVCCWGPLCRRRCAFLIEPETSHSYTHQLMCDHVIISNVSYFLCDSVGCNTPGLCVCVYNCRWFPSVRNTHAPVRNVGRLEHSLVLFFD